MQSIRSKDGEGGASDYPKPLPGRPHPVGPPPVMGESGHPASADREPVTTPGASKCASVRRGSSGLGE